MEFKVKIKNLSNPTEIFFIKINANTLAEAKNFLNNRYPQEEGYRHEICD